MITIILLRLTGEGEIFYLQQRIGRFEKSFRIIKFATMIKASPNIGSGTITAKNDVRILPVGRFLRKTKINEFPQLINILIGDMSFIGPRPHVARDLFGVNKTVLGEIFKHRPGLSGIGSIIFRDEEKILHRFKDPRPFYDEVVAPYKAELELWYNKKNTFMLNMILVILTVVNVVYPRPLINFWVFKDLPEPPNELKQDLFGSS